MHKVDSGWHHHAIPMPSLLGIEVIELSIPSETLQLIERRVLVDRHETLNSVQHSLITVMLKVLVARDANLCPKTRLQSKSKVYG
jgi:hypothetical protein